MQRRMLWRNERSLYKRDCGLCGKSMLAMYHPDHPQRVFCRECWYGDGWNSLATGREYDWSRNFFDQWRDLLTDTPLIGLWMLRSNAGTIFANYVSNTKNCYLTYSTVESEEVLYSYAIDESQSILDSTFVRESNLAYASIDSDKIYNSKYLTYGKECINCSFLFDCVNCQDCFMSINLRNARYVFRNQQLSREEYQAESEKLNLGSYVATHKLQEEYANMVRTGMHKYADILKCVHSTGENLEDCKNTRESYEAYNCENLKYCIRAFGAKDCADVHGLPQSELVYDSVTVGYGNAKVCFMLLNSEARDSAYSGNCQNCANIFGCVGLRNKQYCILNKQYTKEEYEELVPKIIEHMNAMPYAGQNGRIYRYGEFFPSEISPFAYNETLAEEQYPLTKEQALAQGYAWREPDTRNYQVTKINSDLPDDIADAEDSILEDVLGCGHEGKCGHNCTTAFKIIPAELDFYRRMRIPLPRLCPNCRHAERLKKRNPMKLWKRSCACAGEKSENGRYNNRSAHFHGIGSCPNIFETTYAPDRPEAVYCEKCYQAEVI